MLNRYVANTVHIAKQQLIALIIPTAQDNDGVRGVDDLADQQLGLRGLGGGRGVDRAQRRSDTAWTGVSAASDGVREPRD